MGEGWTDGETDMPYGFVDLYYSSKRKGYDIRAELGRPSKYQHQGLLIRLYATKSLYHTTAHSDQGHPLYYVDRLDDVYLDFISAFGEENYPVAQRGNTDPNKPMRFFSPNTDKRNS